MIRSAAEMGEVKVEVELANMIDIELAARGDLDPNEVRRVRCQAVIDTGAVTSAIPKDIADQLGVRIGRTAPVTLADGKSQRAGIVYGILFSVMDRDTTDEAFVLGKEVLIGQTVLEKTDLLVDCKNQRLIGNPEHPDGPMLRI